jgi:NAD(P)H-dependent FMN reductase
VLLLEDSLQISKLPVYVGDFPLDSVAAAVTTLPSQLSAILIAKIKILVFFTPVYKRSDKTGDI